MNRFFLSTVIHSLAIAASLAAIAACLTLAGPTPAVADDVLDRFKDPPRELSVMPFWFWNDELKDEEIVRQIADFEAHGVYGFVIHPRIGLPRDIGWLSPRMIHAMHVAVNETVRRKMYVILYDEGMYPSGSSAGQVVARNPGHAARGLAKIDLEPGENPRLEEGWKLVATLDRPNGRRMAVVERPTGGVIRGLHYRGEETGKIEEELPPAGDILNPEAVSSFIELVYDRYAEEFGEHFGKTILGIFTDEPSPTGRGGQRGIQPGNAALFDQIGSILGYDFKPFLADLWYDDGPGAAQHRADYQRAIAICLEENYYRRLSRWCDQRGVALTGHPGGSMDIGAERYFQVPGQDLVWRMVVPGSKALDGPDSTAAKCASSAMVHLGRRRNANELYGAYGHELTYDEMEWLASWCLVRGHNLLHPHAFYYSVRGPRKDERPPDVGPNAAWWGQYRPYADYCRRLSWLNTDSRHVCQVAILAEPARLPDQSAKICYQHQRDFNYLEIRHLGEDATVEPDGVHLAGMCYRVLILDGALHVPAGAMPPLQKLAAGGRLIILGSSPHAAQLKGARALPTAEELPAAIDSLVTPDLTLTPASASIRYRHVVKGGRHFYLLFNEEESPVTAKIDLSVRGSRQWLDPFTAAATPSLPEETVVFKPHELKVVTVAEPGRSE